MRMRNTIFTMYKGAPYRLVDQKGTEGKMVGVFLKLAVFITLSLHYVAAQGTTPSAAPSLVITPTSYSVDYSSTVLMTCVAYLGPDTEDHSSAAISWTDPAGQTLSNDSDSMVTIYAETQTQNGLVFLESILEICSVGVSHAGQFSCRAANLIGGESFSWNISFTKEITTPQLVVTPVNQDINYSDTVLMVCVATSFPEPVITWNRNGELLDPASSDLITIYTEMVLDMGLNFTVSILEICGVGVDDIGSFTCTATSDAGTVTSAPFTVGILPNSTEVALVITPSSDTVDIFSTVLLVCVAQGDPTPSISWDFEGSSITNETSFRHTTYNEALTQGNLMFVQSILEICSIKEAEGGDYTCNVTNGFISKANTTTITVVDNRVAPAIIVSPNVTDPLTEGNTVAVACTATGHPYPTIQWYRDGVLLTNESLTMIHNEVVEQNGVLFTASILEVSSVGADDRGSYRCVASNSAGNDSFDFDIQVMPGEASVVIAPVDYRIDESVTVVAVCVGTGFPQPSISWSHDGSPLENSSRVTIYEEVVKESGLTFLLSFLEVCSVDFMDAGLYQCTVTNRPASASSNFTLTINRIRDLEPPQLVVTPNASIEVDAGTTVTYVCMGYGEDEPPNIIWEFEDQLLSNDTSSLVTIYESQVVENRLVFSQSILELDSVETENTGMYTCTANNSRGSNSSTFTLNVRPRIAPTIFVHPNVTDPFYEGDTVALACTATGRPYPTIQWYKNGALLTDESLTTIYNEEVEQNGLLFTTSILEVCNVSTDDRGTYSCVAKNPAGNDTSEFDIQVMLDLEPPQLVVTPNASIEVDAGTTVTYVCMGYGEDEPPNIIWEFEDQLLSNDTSSLVTIYESQVVENRLVFSQSVLELYSVEVENAGMYTCTANNSRGSNSSTFTLNVRSRIAPIIVSHPNVTDPFAEGDTVSLVCTATGRPYATIQWYRDGQEITNDSLTSVHNEQVKNSGLLFTSSILELYSVGPDDHDTYSCVASNFAGNDSVELKLQVRAGEASVVIAPVDYSIEESATVVALCVGTGFPQPSIFWNLDGSPLENSTNVTIYEEVIEESGLTFVQSFLEVCSVDFMDAGLYQCTVANRIVSASSNFTLTVKGEASIVIAPVDYTIDESATMVAACVGTGFPQPSISWTLDGSSLENSTNVTIYEEVIEESEFTFIQSFLEVCSVDFMDAGLYQCTVANRIVSDSSNFTLTVNILGASIIVAPPSNVLVRDGETVMIICTGTGVSPEISWSRDGDIVTNATDDDVAIYEEFSRNDSTRYILSILEICNAQESDEGVYKCTVTSYTHSNTVNFTLTVISIPAVIAIAPANTYPIFNTSVLLVCVATGYPLPMITWYHEGEQIDNPDNIVIKEVGEQFLQSTLLLCSVQETTRYNCSVSNGVPRGAITSVTARVVVEVPVSITAQPTDSTVLVNSSATFTCSAYGTVPIDLTWYHMDSGLDEAAPTRIDDNQVTRNETGSIEVTIMSTLTLASVGMADNGDMFYCEATNNLTQAGIFTNQSDSVTLTVQFPPIVSAETQLTQVLTGEDFKLVFAIFDNPQVLPSDKIWSFISSHSGQETIIDDSADQRFEFSPDMSTLTIMSVSLLDDGVYTVRANNPAGSDSDSTRVTVYASPYITSTGQNVTVAAGGHVSFSCSADGVPTPSISWFKDNIFISTASGKKFELTENTITSGIRENINETFTSMLTIVGVSESDAGLYACGASNGCGLNAIVRLPFNLIVTLAPPPDFCDPNPCQNGGSCESGALTYICKCTNSFKGTNCNEAVFDRTPPKIEYGPQTTFVSIYTSVNLTCVVSGSPQPSIQWFKDNLPLTGEVYPSYYIQSIELNDRGVYHCEATNSEGLVESNGAVINILGIQQYTVELYYIPLGAFGVMTFSDEVVQGSRRLVNNLNEQLAGRTISGVLIFSVAPHADEEKFVTHDAAVNNVKVSTVLTMLVLPGSDGIIGRNVFEGTTLITPEVLSEVTDAISETINDLGYHANVSQPARLDSCATEQTVFDPANTINRTLNWMEAAIGAVAMIPCPCGEFEIGREATRVCMGNFRTRGMWREPDYSSCEFTEKTWQLCDATQVGIGSLLVLTGTPDPDDVDHLGIAVSTQYIEQQMTSALQNATASNQFLDLIDNLLQYPEQALKNAHTEFNTSAKMMAALERLSDSYPVTQNPQVIIKDMYTIIIYDSLSPQTFTGQVVFADIGAEFMNDTFQASNILFNSFDGVPTASIGLPRSLLSGHSGDHRIVFNFFLNNSFFIRRDSYIIANNLQYDKLGGLAVAAHIAGGVKVTNLSDPVNMTFAINPKYHNSSKTTCSFWDQSLDNYYGGWSSRGCRKISGNTDNVLCHCTHLTSFGLLVDTFPHPLQSDSSIGRITSLGQAILLLLALVVIVSYLISSVRSSKTSIFLINLCVSLMALSVSYIASNYAMANNIVCQVSSFFLHFTLLLSAGAMAIMLFFMIYYPYTSFRKRIWFATAIIINFLFSVVVAVVSIVLNPDNYFSEEFCRPSSHPYWFGLLLIGGIELLITTVLFIVGANVRKRPLRSKDDVKSFWIGYFGLFIVFMLFYIAWGFGLPAAHSLNLGPARLIFQVIFIVATIALGVLMLIFFCILSPEIRKAWKSIFCCLVPGHSKKHIIGEHQSIKNVHMTDCTAIDSNLKEEAVSEVSFTFTDNTLENPVAANIHKDSMPTDVEKELEGAEDGDTDLSIKTNLSAVSDDPDDQKQSSL